MLLFRLFSKRDRDMTEHRSISNLLILLTIGSILIIIGYMLLLHQLDTKDGSDFLSLTSTRPIEKPRITNGALNVYNKQTPEKYNEFEFKSRIIQEKIQRLTHQSRKANVSLEQAPANFTIKNVHIFYSAPVKWHSIENTSLPGDATLSPLDTLNIVFQPMLGIYSLNTQILKKHFQNIKDMGIGVIIVTWSPNKQQTEMLKNILNFAKQYFAGAVSVSIEIDAYPERSADSVRNDLEFLHREFIWSHPSLYRVFVETRQQYLPMVYIKNVSQIGHREWSSIFSSRASDTVRKTTLDAIFIGHISGKSEVIQIRQAYIDGFYTRLVSNGATYTSSWKNWEILKKLATKYKIIFIPTVGPGYNEKKKEPKMGGLRRHRSNGQYYDVAWRTAITTNVQFITISSYNDWCAGTQIEEAISRAGYKDYEPAGPRKYLELTKRWIKEFLRITMNDTSLKNCAIVVNNTVC